MTDETPSDLRTRLNNALDGIEDDFLKGVVADLFSMTRLKSATVDVKCRSCGKESKQRAQIESPDYRGIASALATLTDQGKGKPKETVVVNDTAAVEAAVRKVLAEMSSDELERIAA